MKIIIYQGELPESSPSKKQFQSSQEFPETSGNFHKVTRTKPPSASNTQQSLIPVVYTPQWSPTQIQVTEKLTNSKILQNNKF